MSKAITIHFSIHPTDTRPVTIQPIETTEAAAAMARLQETGTLSVTSAGLTHYFGVDAVASAYVVLSDASEPGGSRPG